MPPAVQRSPRDRFGRVPRLDHRDLICGAHRGDHQRERLDQLILIDGRCHSRRRATRPEVTRSGDSAIGRTSSHDLGCGRGVGRRDVLRRVLVLTERCNDLLTIAERELEEMSETVGAVSSSSVSAG